MAQTNPIAALGDLDPKKVSQEDFTSLLEAATEAASSNAEADLSELTPEQFARIISRASDAQLKAVMERPVLRERILDEVFRRMEEHYKPGRTKKEAVVRWRIGTANDEPLRYECTITKDTCTVSKDPQQEPLVTITIGPVEFIKLVSGNASAPMMFMTGKLKLAGDVGFAAGLTKLFQIPKA